jgi:hypothetical protein
MLQDVSNHSRLSGLKSMGRIGIAVCAMLAYCCASAVAAHEERFQSAGWTLSVNRDAFTQEVRCALGAVDHRLTFQPGAIGFRFGHRRDTLEAWYRIDDGQPVRWQDRITVLTAAGVEIDGPAMNNPTGGWVWIPAGELQHADRVAIRLHDKAKVRLFRLRGFEAMFDAARRLGCVSDASFRS